MIIGHQKIINLLDKAILKNSVAGAYLFVGPKAVGKFTVALQFAEKLTGGGQAINPNLIILKPEEEDGKKKDIKVEAVRELQQRLSLTAENGKYQVAIIDEADRLNQSAQNALLKTLEEPQEKVVLILIVENPKKILPTIWSRCQKKRFEIVSSEELEKNMPERNANKKEILFWSLGRPGLMLNFLNNAEELSLRQNAEKELQKLTKGNVAEKFALAENMAKGSEDIGQKIDWWLILLREVVLGQKNDLQLGKSKALELTEMMGKSLTLIKETNANNRLILENLFLNF